MSCAGSDSSEPQQCAPTHTSPTTKEGGPAARPTQTGTTTRGGGMSMFHISKTPPTPGHARSLDLGVCSLERR
jgi:hypothetical protein